MKKKTKNDNENKKKKKRILFAILFGILGAGAIATAITVPLVLLNKKTDPEPVVGPEFSVETEATMWDPIYTTLKLDWTPAEDEIEFSNWSFTYNGRAKAAEYIDVIESPTGSVSLKLTFNEIIYENNISDGILSFNYNDKTTGKTGQASVENINIQHYVAPTELIFKIEKDYTTEKLIIDGFKEGLEQKPTDLIIPSYIEIDDVFTEVAQIGQSAFNLDHVIKTLVIPSSISVIGESAFTQCDKLTSVSFDLHSQIEKIPAQAFSPCEKLESISLPNTITEIGNGAFTDDTYLESIYYGGTKEEWGRINCGTDCWAGVGESVVGGTTVHCTDGDIPLEPS